MFLLKDQKDDLKIVWLRFAHVYAVLELIKVTELMIGLVCDQKGNLGQYVIQRKLRSKKQECG